MEAEKAARMGLFSGRRSSTTMRIVVDQLDPMAQRAAYMTDAWTTPFHSLLKTAC